MIDVQRLVRRLRAIVFRRDLERDLDDELRFHLDMQTTNNVQAGMRPEEARAVALRDFGGVERHKDGVRDARGITVLDDLRRDARFSLRSLGRSPGFTTVALLTLALGIGSTTAIFSVVNGVLLVPLPFPEPERLVRIWETTSKFDRSAVSAPNFADWHAQSRSFEAMAAYRVGDATVLGGTEPVRARTAGVSGEFFRLLRAKPFLGRTFLPEESRVGGAPVAVVSHAFWQRSLSGDRALGNKHVTTWGTTYTVVGVMPPGFDFPEQADLWIPVEPQNAGMGRSSHNDDTIGRLAQGVTVERARSELSAIAARLHVQYPTNNDATGANVMGLQDEMVGPVRTYLSLLLGAVGFVLLVACVNLASANLARGAAREREMTIRAALGAGKGRLVRQLLTENVLLALGGGAAGLVLAVWLVRVLVALSPRSLPRASNVGVDVRVMLFTLGLSVLTGLLIALLPALQVSGAELRGPIAEGSNASVGGGRGRLRRVLVAAEVALALVLLVGAGLLIRSFRTLLAEDPGFDPRGVVTVDVSLPRSKYSDGGKIASYYDAALAGLTTLPGIDAVGSINIVPLKRAGFGSGMALADRPAEVRYADYRVVGGDYFRAMRIPLVAGRVFGAGDDSTATHVTVINQTMANRFWPGESPIGKRVRSLGMDDHKEVWLTVIGVVRDVRHASLTAAVGPQSFVSYRQRPERDRDATLVVRSRAPAAVVAAVRERVRSVDHDVPVELATMDEVLARSVADRRFTTTILAGFGALALALAAIGIYGVLSYSVVRRTREIGVRMALGARGSTVLALVLRDSMVPVVAGIVAGVIGAAALTRLLRSLLYGVSATDGATFAIVVALLAGVALLASYLPARRAARIDPVAALRAE